MKFIKNPSKYGEFRYQKPVAWCIEGGKRRVAVCGECASGSGSAQAVHLDAFSCNPLTPQNGSFSFLISGKLETQSNLLIVYKEE